MKITLCVLTRNEAECLKVLLPKLPTPSPEAGFNQVVAIDGDSTDETVAILSSYGIPVIAKSPKGRGQAFLKAFEQIDSDAYLFFSPDGNEALGDLSKFKPLLEGGADLVIASRMMKGARNEEDSQLLRFRKWANLVFNFFANLLFSRSGPYLTDSINGFRAITRQAATRLELDALDYTIEYQMSIRAMREGLTIHEFPTVEGPRIAGETGASSIPTGLRFLKRLWLEYLSKPSRERSSS